MVKNVRALIDEEKYDESADVILQALATVINTHSVMISVTKKDLLAVGPALISALQGSSGEEGSEGSEPAEPEKTDAPGDDIEVTPSSATLTITFVGPEGDSDIRLPNTIVRKYLIGQKYKFTPHTIKGYTVSPAKATGVMTAEGATVEFTYTAEETSASSDPESGTSTTEPGTSTTEPGTSTTEPGTSTTEPGTSTNP